MPPDSNAKSGKNAKNAKNIAHYREALIGIRHAPILRVFTSKEQKEFAERFKIRSRRFALDVIVLCRRIPRTMDGYVIAKQLIKAATATAANYRAACRARSPADFVSRISVVAEEADESHLWLDMTIAAGILSDDEAKRLLAEASELTAIFTKSRDTAKANAAVQQGSSVLSVPFVLLALLALLAFLALR